MKDKYVEEAFRRWFVFGTRGDSSVDLFDGDEDILTGISPEQAEELIAARNQFVDRLCQFFHQHPDTLSKVAGRRL